MLSQRSSWSARMCTEKKDIKLCWVLAKDDSTQQTVKTILLKSLLSVLHLFFSFFCEGRKYRGNSGEVTHGALSLKLTPAVCIVLTNLCVTHLQTSDDWLSIARGLNHSESTLDVSRTLFLTVDCGSRECAEQACNGEGKRSQRNKGNWNEIERLNSLRKKIQKKEETAV